MRNLEGVFRLLRSDAYADAQRRIAGLKQKMSRANRFLIPEVLEECEAYFSGLRKGQPQIYEVVRIQEKELGEIAYRKIHGRRIIGD